MLYSLSLSGKLKKQFIPLSVQNEIARVVVLVRLWTISIS